MIYLDNKINIFTTKGLVKPAQLYSNLILKNYLNKIQIIEKVESVRVKGKTVYLDNGESYFVSDENSLLTLDGVSSVKNIKMDDFIAFKANSSFSPSPSKELGWINEFRTRFVPIRVPENLSLQLAYWLGIYSSRGFINQKTNTIYINVEYNDSLSDRIVSLTKEIFDLTPDVVFKNGNKHVVIYSANLLKFLRNQCGNKNKFKKIPSAIQNSSLDEQFAYFLGLSHKAYQEKSKIVFAFNSILFTNFIGSLLKNLGFLISRKVIKTERGNIFYTNILARTKDFDLSTFNILGIKINNNIDLLKIEKSYLVKVPNLNEVKVKYNNPSVSAFKRIKKNKTKLANCSVVENWKIPFDNEIYYSQVVKIEEDEKDATAISLKNNGGVVVDNLILFE